MDDTTIVRLNTINRDFYQTVAADFDETRGQAWPGWARLLPHLAAPLAVLDVGCGNGRFGRFLADHLGGEVHYHGLDNCPPLLDKAREALPGALLEARDIVEQPPDSGLYDLVVLFGVLHHVPGYEKRQRLLGSLAERVRPGGLLVFATWRFYEYERFRQRIVPWPDDLAGLVEAHDYLLDWRRGRTALRYCHYVDEAEQSALVAASGLALVEQYRADGFDGAVNGYNLLRKAQDLR